MFVYLCIISTKELITSLTFSYAPKFSLINWFPSHTFDYPLQLWSYLWYAIVPNTLIKAVQATVLQLKGKLIPFIIMETCLIISVCIVAVRLHTIGLSVEYSLQQTTTYFPKNYMKTWKVFIPWSKKNSVIKLQRITSVIIVAEGRGLRSIN